MTVSFPDEPHVSASRSALAELKAKILSACPRRDVDRLVFSLLDRSGSDRFLEAVCVQTFKVEDEADYEERTDVVLCSTDDPIGYVATSGETVYWGGIKPDFWAEWRALPRYSTDYDAALRLKSSVLGFGRPVFVEQFEIYCPTDDGATEVLDRFRARIRHTDGTFIDGPQCNHAAGAVLTAMLDYILTVGLRHLDQSDDRDGQDPSDNGGP
jgi:hypothetical protein